MPGGDDYGYLNVDEPFEVLPEPGSSMNVVYPDDILKFYPIWDQKLLESFPNLLKVNQPLFHILNKNIQDKATLVANGESKMDSILNCYYRNGTPVESIQKKLVGQRSASVSYPY